MPLGRPFIDSKGKIGKPKLTSKTVANSLEGKQIRFDLFNSTHITVRSPARVKETIVRVNKKDGIKLAHWLLDKCTTKRE